MSVLVTLRIQGDATSLENLVDKDPQAFAQVAKRGAEMGATYHRFYATEDEILVIDEWPTADAFQAFFDSTPEIAGFMQEAGVTSPPVVTMWRKLELGDDIG